MRRNAMKGQKGLCRLINAVKFSKDGYCSTWKDEEAFRQIVIMAALGIVLALFLCASVTDFVVLVAPLFICVIVELLNSAIENVVDLVSLEYSDLAKKAKDMGSAAQFTSQIFLFLVWSIYLVRYFLHL